MRRARRENSHRAGRGFAVAEAGGETPVLADPPARFAVTIEDVAVDGTFPADGFADRVGAWAAATLSAAAPPGA